MNTVIAVLSDMHSGSSVALFPDRMVQFKHTNHTPTPMQRELYDHFIACADHAAARRKGKKLLVVHNGDAIEGVHHSTREVVTYVKGEQVGLHVDLMNTFLKRVEFSRDTGDKLYYVTGTEVHVGDWEDDIAKDLGAERAPSGSPAFDHMELNVNGRLLWFVHHGPTRGKGPNEGNGLRNWLRDIYYDCEKVRVPVPDVVISGHTHTPTYNTFVARREDGFHTIHGIVCPSWQRKTRYANAVAPVERNEVGAVVIEIGSDGQVHAPTILMTKGASAQAVVA